MLVKKDGSIGITSGNTESRAEQWALNVIWGICFLPPVIGDI